MAFGRESTVSGERQPEWWICCDKYPGPYADPDFIAVADRYTSGTEKLYWYDIDKSNLKTIMFNCYRYFDIGEVILIDGEPLGWVMSTHWNKNSGGVHSVTTVEYQPY